MSNLNTRSNNFLLLGLFLLCVLSAFFALFLGDDGLMKMLFVDETTNQILLQVRLPRIIMALLIGMLLASSGVVTQSVFQNPIADPYVIGIASAATFGAVVSFLLRLSDVYYALFAFISCVLFSLFIFAVSKKASITSLLIIGIASSSFLGAFTSFFIYYIGEDSFKIVAWLMGNIGFASWSRVIMLFVPLVFCLLYFYAYRNELNIIVSGDYEARTLGVNAEKIKMKLLLASSLAVSLAVCFSGLIAFVGLIIPHISRLLLKNYSNAVILPFSTLLGGLFLLFCDTLARTILSPVQIPIGIVSAFFGSILFLYLALNATRFYNA